MLSNLPKLFIDFTLFSRFQCFFLVLLLHLVFKMIWNVKNEWRQPEKRQVFDQHNEPLWQQSRSEKKNCVVLYTQTKLDVRPWLANIFWLFSKNNISISVYLDEKKFRLICFSALASYSSSKTYFNEALSVNRNCVMVGRKSHGMKKLRWWHTQGKKGRKRDEEKREKKKKRKKETDV